MISDRTKAGLAAAKARGVKLGGPGLPAINELRRVDSVARARAIAPILSELASMSARAAAAELNARKIETPSGAPWSARTVIRARARVGFSFYWICGQASLFDFSLPGMIGGVQLLEGRRFRLRNHVEPLLRHLEPHRLLIRVTGYQAD